MTRNLTVNCDILIEYVLFHQHVIINPPFTYHLIIYVDLHFIGQIKASLKEILLRINLFKYLIHIFLLIKSMVK